MRVLYKHDAKQGNLAFFAERTQEVTHSRPPPPLSSRSGTLSSLLLLQHLDAEHGGAVDSSVLGSRGEAGGKSKGDDVGEMEEEEDSEAQILKSSLYSDFSIVLVLRQ